MKLSTPFRRSPASRRLLLGALLAVGTLLGGVEVRAKDAEREITIELDYARVVKIPPGAHTLVIGNPLIADVTMLKSNQLMVITGKSFGTTNLVVLDGAGLQVGESLITVVPANDKLVVLRGPHRESYSCKPECTPAVDLADDHTYMTETLSAAKQHQDALTIGKH
ncbi:MAG TPA: pilus assembly protein N-terminal domain-containing protein [Methylocystis sp.]|nr:pilus assembly protein N-terminal domain-containing protein [Methylocystis sp.]